VVDKIRRNRSLTSEEFTHARVRATKPLKVTLPSPLMMTLRWSPEWIEKASRYFPRERLALSTQCGVGTVWEGNPILEPLQAAKLKLVADIAHRVWT
jgi:methionine synthase II (cobalamin-independent)